MAIERQEKKAGKRTEPTRRYDDEILSANWNPAIALVAMSCNQIEQGLRSRLPEDLTMIDVDAFLDRVYALA
jgi:uncharacterized membrane protein YqgA involved in biofilm formation